MSWKRITSALRKLFTPTPKPRPKPRLRISYPLHIRSSAPIYERASTPYYTPVEQRPCSEISMTCVGIDSVICSDAQMLEELRAPYRCTETEPETDTDASSPHDTVRTSYRGSTNSMHEKPRIPWSPLELTAMSLDSAENRCSRFTVSDYARDSFVYIKSEREIEIEKEIETEIRIGIEIEAGRRDGEDSPTLPGWVGFSYGALCGDAQGWREGEIVVCYRDD